MKDMKEIREHLDSSFFEGPIEEVSNTVLRLGENLKDVRIEYGWDEYEVIGYREFTSKEKAANAKRAEKAAAAAAKRKQSKEDAERAVFDRLKQKYGEAA